jgi:hypothetical protein
MQQRRGKSETAGFLSGGARSTYFDVEATPAASGTHRKGQLELASHDLGTTALCCSSGGRQTVGTPADGAVGHQQVAAPSRALPHRLLAAAVVPRVNRCWKQCEDRLETGLWRIASETPREKTPARGGGSCLLGERCGVCRPKLADTCG